MANRSKRERPAILGLGLIASREKLHFRPDCARPHESRPRRATSTLFLFLILLRTLTSVVADGFVVSRRSLRVQLPNRQEEGQ